jgi:ABC-type proline/glycine betaine transport system ATPase subunit
MSLDLIGLRKAHGSRAAVDDISLSIASGTLLALVGPSGSGKTSLLKMINRLMRDRCGSTVSTSAIHKPPNCAAGSAM